MLPSQCKNLSGEVGRRACRWSSLHMRWAEKCLLRMEIGCFARTCLLIPLFHYLKLLAEKAERYLSRTIDRNDWTVTGCSRTRASNCRNQQLLSLLHARLR
jgi:hypothetical protein